MPPCALLVASRDGETYFQPYVYENNYIDSGLNPTLTRINPKHRMLACVDGYMISLFGMLR